ncbi:hypothetical protein BT69DRAFT_1285564 [Atractiella rhizophila]|nr:hypothetical protein BT69DRAFT_1285564 [Atractiella rhizophila]
MQAHARTTSRAMNDAARHRSTFSQQSSLTKSLPQHIKGAPSTVSRAKSGFQVGNVVSILWNLVFTIAVFVFLSSLFGMFYTAPDGRVDVSLQMENQRILDPRAAYGAKKEPQLQHLDLSDPAEGKPNHDYQLPLLQPNKEEEDVFGKLSEEDVSQPDVLKVDGKDSNEDEEEGDIRIREPEVPAIPEGKLRIVRGKGAFGESGEEDEEDGPRRLKKERRF